MEAERALLGSLLLDPRQLTHLDWLSAGHFYHPVHQALFAAMRDLRADGHPALTTEQAVPLSWVNDTVEAAGRHVLGITSVYAHTLISACPRTDNAPIYGRMVMESAIRRIVAEHAVHLHQTARADAMRGQVEGTLRSAVVLAKFLDDLGRRWGIERHPAITDSPPSTSSTAPPPVRAGKDAGDERLLLGVLVELPESMDEVVGWLRPADFADPVHGHIYRCLGALHHRGEPIDRITVAWEAQRRGLLTNGTLTREQITAIGDGIGAGSAEWLGERVIRSSVTRTAAASAWAIRALAEKETLAPGRLIGHALDALDTLGTVRDRWLSAQGGPVPKPVSALPKHEFPTARMHAALARSTTQPAVESPQGPAPASAVPRPPSRARG
ncbi:DnaB-like helicase N-terminal domain-containing protein [Streptomyces sp. NPDC004838]